MASHLFSSTHSSLVLLVGCSVMVAQLPSSISSWATALKKKWGFQRYQKWNQAPDTKALYCTYILPSTYVAEPAWGYSYLPIPFCLQNSRPL